MATHQDQFECDARGLSFISPEFERKYLRWRVDQNRPVIRLICAVSIVAWVALSALPLFLEAASAPLAQSQSYEFIMLTYGVVVPLLIFGYLTANWKRWRYENVLVGVGLTVIGVVQQWLIINTLDVVSGSLGSAILFSAFALFMRLRPLAAALSVTPILLSATYFQYAYGRSGATDAVEEFLAYGLLFCIGFFVCVISIVSERLFRQAFLNEQLVVSQKMTLEENQILIRRYVPRAVAEHITAGQASSVNLPQRRRVTVLFSDIVGFTELADRLDAESLTQVINEYMATMADIVEAHDGTLNEFAGDGLMALFGAPKELSPEDQVLNAVRAAQKMQTILPELNNGWRKLGIGEPLKIRIGINTGVLSVGSFGSEGRMTYTAIGLQTNIAFRIESEAEPGEILISDASYQLISEKVDCEPRGEVQCKGVHFPVKLYAPNRGN